ncbi:MAG: transketolase [Actinobacteria bacterium HGW-Actinobacteria-7]|nr:MAG: transketolase [Actinobacteria bacterium HGW-Actinobacteria-7]
MRTAFVEQLCALAEADERIWLLTGDLGFSVLERFADAFPQRFVNAGVAEQNMIGVAAGLALSGKVPFVYSIANFPVMRCLEQIRNDVCYHGLDVKVVSVGGGMVYGSQGYTHHGVEDIAVMSALPGMSVLAPADPVEAAWAATAAVDRSGPVYVRLGKAGDPVLHSSPPQLEFGRAVTVREGADATLVSTGAALRIALEAASELESRGVHARVLSMPTVKPVDVEALTRAATDTPLVVTIEEHGPVGGLYSAVLEVIAPLRAAVCVRVALADEPAPMAGSCAYLSERSGLDPHSVAKTVLSLVGGKA